MRMKDEVKKKHFRSSHIPHWRGGLSRGDDSRGISSSRGEFELIKRIRRRASVQMDADEDSSSAFGLTPRAPLLVGIGDDAAILGQSGRSETVITTDLLVEEIDFRLETMPPRFLGHKALAVSLSDIAAMGARPRWSLLSIGIPRKVWRSSFVDDFYEGFFSLARRHGVTLIGGDVSRTPERIVVDSIALGEVARGRAILRAGASPGDHIFVTGTLGGSAAGLRLLADGARLQGLHARSREDNWRSPERAARSLERGAGSGAARTIEALLLCHLRPEARVEWGALLAAERLATAMIDLSDGLSSDLAHLCRESGVGAVIEASRVPVNPLAMRLGHLHHLEPDPLALALDGGEDFELLFTVSPRRLKGLPPEVCGVPATYIGDVTNQAGRVMLRDGARQRRLRAGGFSHF